MDANIINQTYELVDEIKENEIYIRLVELKQLIETDPVVVGLVETFNKVKIKYEEVQKYGKYHPDLKKVSLELKDIKETLYTNVIIKEYKQLEKKLQKVLDEVSRTLAQTVSHKIKHPNEMGLINKH